MNRPNPAAAVATALSGAVALALIIVSANVEPEHAALSVESSPSGASVFLGGEFRGVTPLAIDGIVPGTYPLRLEAGGYLPETASVEVVPPGREIVFELEREPTGSIHVISTPSGAEVFFEGVYRGVTPLTLEAIEVGDHQLRVEKTNHHPWVGVVGVADGSVAKVAPELADRILEFLRHSLREDASDILRNMEYSHHLFVSGDYEAAAAAYGDGLLLAREQILDLSRAIEEAQGDADTLRALRQKDRDKKEDLKKLERQMQRDVQAGPQPFRRLVELERARVQASFPQSIQMALNEADRAAREGDLHRALDIIQRGIHVLGTNPQFEEKLAHYQARLEEAAE